MQSINPRIPGLLTALTQALEASVDSGTATGGTNTTLVDTGKNWATNLWANAIVECAHAGRGYLRSVTSNTSDTLTFGVLPNLTGTTIAFVDSDPDTITDSNNGFVTAGFVAGMELTVSGSTSNDGTYTIDTVTAGTVTLEADETLVAELAGATVTLSLNVQSGDSYSLKVPVTVQDVARWGGTVLTGRDISTDLENLGGAVTYSAPVTYNATTLSTEAVATNANRKILTITNASDTDVFVGVGAAAVVDSGVMINAGGGVVQFGGPSGLLLTTQAINVIHAGTGNKALAILEGE